MKNWANIWKKSFIDCHGDLFVCVERVLNRIGRKPPLERKFTTGTADCRVFP